ncbi:FadR/GntR family transcriptional regulator [Paenibacillus eucommiae]|uniref:DNA-binding FadR family transcriptional regulator n=1 Tax=Paenibacillus eucommiae TaxID=1355755 RepID=A0ABS4ITB8_9BACL|nr:FadR/GntR family transcriptional regulator [Paenibacillus eucommiae]MBP1990798.1 DNA-binding FadR family transcriptional regulator [Paenibacillus eucommiae]
MQIPKKRTLSDIVTERIKSYILNNRLVAGDKLPSEKELIEQLGVSRTVVREALKILQMVGVIRIKSGEGIFVDDPSLKSVVSHFSFQWRNDATKMNELLETRIVLELGAIDMAIKHYSPALIEEMEIWNEKIRVKKNGFDQEDLGFHRSLFQATGNSVYLQLSEILTDFFNAVHTDNFHYEQELRQSFEQHAEIISWIKRKNAKMAKQIMMLHLEPLYLSMEQT